MRSEIYKGEISRSDRRLVAGERLLSEMVASGDDDLESDRGIGVVEEIAKPELKRPPMYKVMLMNDDYTPMEFVIEILQLFFNMNRDKATQIMLAVHTNGKAACGVFTRDIAETKSAQVNQYAQECQHPLISEIEPAD